MLLLLRIIGIIATFNLIQWYYIQKKSYQVSIPICTNPSKIYFITSKDMELKNTTF